MKSYAKSWILKASLILGFLAIDLVSKYLLQNYFDNGGNTIAIIPKIFNIEYVKNTGISFGMFKESVVASLILPIIFLGIFSAYDIVGKEKNVLYSFGFAMIVSGALGNLYDRIFLKFVRDFFAFSFFPFVFNFADACITIGFILIVVNYIITLSKKEKMSASNKSKKKAGGDSEIEQINEIIEKPNDDVEKKPEKDDSNKQKVTRTRKKQDGNIEGNDNGKN